MNATYTAGSIVAFLFEKSSKPYKEYSDTSTAKETFTIAQKLLQRRQLCCASGAPQKQLLWGMAARKSGV